MLYSVRALNSEAENDSDFAQKPALIGLRLYDAKRRSTMTINPRFAVGKRWTPELAADGWTPVAYVFLKKYHKLKITSSEAMLLIHLVSHKWDSNLPFPATSTLAERMGITETAVRNNIRSLEKKKLLKRLPQKGKTNLFDLSLLFKKLMLSDEELKALYSKKELSAKGDQDVGSE